MNQSLAERDVSQQVVSLMERMGWRGFRMQCGFFKRPDGAPVYVGEKGYPDWRFEYYLLPGFTLTLYCEIKRPGGRTRPEQDQWIFGMRARGALIWVVDDLDRFMTDYEECFGWLQTGGRARVENALKAIAGVE